MVTSFRDETVVLNIPWSCLASDNLRKGLDPDSWGKYKTARDRCHMVALDQVRGDRPRFPGGALEVDIRFILPDYRHRDPNNVLKALCDSLEGVVYADDHQIRSLSWLVLDVDPSEPRAEIEVKRRLR